MGWSEEMAESQSKRVEDQEKSRKKERLQNQRDKISLETGICVLVFPYMQVPPVSARSGRKPEKDR